MFKNTCSRLKGNAATYPFTLVDEDSIIFSCWTKTLELVEVHLERIGLTAYTRIDGDTPLGQRQKILDEFAADDSIRVLLMTTGTGAFG